MSDDELFRTGRMQTLRGMTPAYMPGANVFLQRDIQGFTKGSAGRVISVQSSRPGEHRYQLSVGEQKMWVFEADIRPTPPGTPGSSDQPESLGPTQRMRTMTLSQRMAALGPNATQRMHALTQEERLKKLVQTNRLRILGENSMAGPAPADDASAAPPADSGNPPKP